MPDIVHRQQHASNCADPGATRNDRKAYSQRNSQWRSFTPPASLCRSSEDCDHLTNR